MALLWRGVEWLVQSELSLDKYVNLINLWSENITYVFPEFEALPRGATGCPVRMEPYSSPVLG
jgi:hypothetical protein